MNDPELIVPPRRGWIFLLAAVVVLAAGGLWYVKVNGLSSATHLSRAMKLLESDQLRAGTIELRNALDKDNHNNEARWLLASTLLEMRQVVEAEREFQRLQRLGYQHPDLVINLARTALAQRQFENVLAVSNEEAASSSDARWLVLRGQAMLGLERAERARKEFELALTIDPDNTDATRGLVQVEVMEGRLGAARQEIDRVIANDATSIDAWLMRGELDIALERMVEAQTAFSHALELESDSTAARVGLIRALLGQKKTTEAHAQIQKLALDIPEHPVLLYLDALLAHQKGELDLARRNLRAVLSQQPSHGPSLLLLGQINYATGKLADAASSLEKHISGHEWHVLSRKLLAAIYLRMGNPEKAVSILAPALISGEHDAELLSLLGTSHVQSGNTELGLELLQRSMSLAPKDVRLRTQAAIGMLAGGKIDAGLDELEAIVSDTPEYQVAAMTLAMTHLRRNEWDKAQQAATEYTTSHPTVSEAWALLGIAQERGGDVDAARQSYKRAIEMGDPNHLGHLNLARLEITEGNLDLADAYYSDVLEIDPANSAALIGLAGLGFGAGDTQKGLALLEQARLADDSATIPRLIIGDYYMRLGRVELASQAAREAQRIDPTSEPVAVLVARALLGNAEPKAAAVEIGELTEQFPLSPQLHYLYATATTRLNQIDAARSALKKAMALRPNFVLAHSGLGGLALHERDYESALDIADSLIGAHESLPAGYLLRGEVLENMGDLAGALTAYQSAYKRAPTGSIVLRIYSALAQMGEKAAARQQLTDWLGNNPDDVQVLIVRAWTESQDGDADAAMATYRQILSAAPDNAHAQISLAWLHHRKGEHPRAIELAERAFRSDENDAAVADAYGWILVKAGRTDDGLALLEQALRLAPDDDNRRYRRAYAFAIIGRAADAKQELEQLVLSGREFAEREAARSLLRDLR